MQYTEKHGPIDIAGKLKLLNQKAVLFYDEASKFIGMLIHVVHDKQTALVEYINQTYENVQIYVLDSYLRLDFNKNGSISCMDDLRAHL